MTKHDAHPFDDLIVVALRMGLADLAVALHRDAHGCDGCRDCSPRPVTDDCDVTGCCRVCGAVAELDGNDICCACYPQRSTSCEHGTPWDLDCLRCEARRDVAADRAFDAAEARWDAAISLDELYGS